MTTTTPETTIEADPRVPLIRITREFDASPERVFRAHTDPDLVVQWLGPRDLTMHLDRWDCRTGGEYRYLHARDGEEYWFHGCFHEVRSPDVLVQTFTFEGVPDGVALERMVFEDLGDGRTRIVGTSLVESFEARDAFLASGMEHGVREGHQRLEELLARDAAGAPDGRDDWRRVADGFSARVAGLTEQQWDRPTPCEGWAARDVVVHLVEWVPPFVETGTGIRLPVDADPAREPEAAWGELRAAIDALLDDPTVAQATFDHPQAGRHTVAGAVARFVLGDVLVHTWDLARATGGDETLDDDAVRAQLAGLQAMDPDVLAASGHYAPRVPVPEAADPQTRLLACTGRRA